jgi:hypothetical protein
MIGMALVVKTPVGQHENDVGIHHSLKKKHWGTIQSVRQGSGGSYRNHTI